MASTYDKKFETTETTKAAGAEVVSEPIELSPRSKDHVLVVTANPNITSGTTTTTQTINVPAQTKALVYQGYNAGSSIASWFETTDQVFESHDFSNGISFFLGSSIAYYYSITDKQQLLKTEFTDGSYIKVRNGTGNNNLRIEYRDGTAGQVKYFETANNQNIGKNASNESINDSVAGERYHKTGFSFSPNGFKVTVVIDEDSAAKSLVTSSLTATNGASWSELDFSSKTHSKTTLFRFVDGESIGNAWYALLDVFAVAAKEINYATLDPCTHDNSDVAISGGTSAIVDMLSKDYDRFFLFGDGDSDTLTTSSSSGGTVDIKSHGDSAAVSLTLTAQYHNGNPYSPYWYEYFTYYTGKPQFTNSATTTTREVTTSGGSSVSGVVDVELEMSPDGTNWCPAVSRTVSGGTATQTGDVIGNEESVKLTPDAGEFKNKHARGGLNFDVNGAVVTPDGSGARDLMHQHISVNKSFNYSQWFKTSENPTTTYKPVLLRHGGYDDFENAKTVELNDTTTVTVGSKYLKGYGKVGAATNGNNAYGSTQNPYASSGTSVPQKRTIAFWVNPGNPSTDFFQHIYTEQFGGGAYIAIVLRRHGFSGMFIQVQESDGTNFEATHSPNNQLPINTWMHVVVGLDGGNTGTTNAGTKNCTISINGQTQNLSPFNAGAVTGNTNLSLSNVAFQATNGASAISGLENMGIDEFSIFEGAVATSLGNTDQFIIDLYNSGSRVVPTTLSLPTGVTLKRYLKIGEDDDSVDLFKSYAGITGDFFIKDSSATSASLVNLSSSNPTYYTYSQNQPTTQNLSEPVSTSMSNNYYVAETTANNTDFYSYFSDIQLTSNKKWCISFWMKSSIFASSGTGSYGNRIFGNFAGSGSAGFQMRKKVGTTNTWFLFFNGNSSTYLVAEYTIPSQHNVNNTWVHVLINYSYDSAANSGAISDSIYLASMDLYINGDVCSKADSTAYSSTTHATTLVSHGINIGTWANSPNIVEAYDELAYWDGTSLTTSEIAKVYNSGTPEDLQNTTGLTAPDHWWRHEDSSNLNYDTIAGANSGVISGATQTAITSSDSIAPVSTGVLANLFTTTSNLSISGWFKTTATGTLFSNTEGASATDGMKLEVNASNVVLTLIDSSQTITASTNVRDGEWHHLLVTKSSIDLGTNQCEFKVYVDGALETTSSKVISDDDLKGNNAFTLLGDGQNNANAASPAATDLSKLQASLSNWSLHSEVLDANAARQLYSNGHVRNIKNLPSVTVSAIEAWWQLADTTNPQNDLVGSNHLQYQDGASQTLLSQQVNADGATLVEDTINGNAMTLSLTKSFNFTTNEWVATADQDSAICLSFNGFEEQAEYFALWKCSQTVGGGTIDICDGDWHNVILSYRGRNDLAGNNVSEGDTVKFGPGPANSLAFNWAMSFDGQPLTALNDGSGADYIGGNNAIATDTYNTVSYNVGFNIYNRHLKYETANTEEVYKPHAQFSAGIHEVSGVDNNNSFQGYVDETSFHSDTWWVDQAGTSVVTNTFNQEKPATIYGNTTALDNRQGASTEYPEGKPYPLLNPEKLTTSGQASDIEGTNQYINPNRYDASTNPNGGLEGWWRWGDTAGDCSITINDVKDHNDSINARDIDAFGIVTADRQVMTSADSIFLADTTASSGGGGTTITFPQVKVEGVQAGICNLKNINSGILHYLRVKFKGAGSAELGEGKLLAKICFTNRHKRRK